MHSALASILAGVSKHYAHALIGNVGDGNYFRPCFYKKQYLSNGQTGCREISHKHCKWMAFHDTKKNNRYHSLFIKLFGHRFFLDTV